MCMEYHLHVFHMHIRKTPRVLHFSAFHMTMTTMSTAITINASDIPRPISAASVTVYINMIHNNIITSIKYYHHHFVDLESNDW